MMPEGPWPDLITSGWLSLGGWVYQQKMLATFRIISDSVLPDVRPNFFGAGRASEIIVDELVKKRFL